jgi:hypothetical protein
MEKTLIAKITEKATGRVWHVYRLADGRIAYVDDDNKVTFAEEVTSSSKKNEKHTVFYNTRIAIGCTCKARKFGKGKACKHMMAKTNVLSPKPAPAPAPVVEKKPAKKEDVVKGNLNGNRGFSLMKRAS